MVQNWFYNTLIKKTTIAGYRGFFEEVLPNTSVLDIGVGNGLMFHSFHEFIREHQVRIHGIDLNKQYLKQSQKLIKHYKLQDLVKVEQMNFLEASFQETFDDIFFSMSFPLIPDQGKALENALKWLRPNGKIAFFQTLQMEPSKTMEFIKPKLKFISTIDFGKVTYEDSFKALLEEKGLQIIKRRSLHKVSKSSEVQVIFAQPIP